MTKKKKPSKVEKSTIEKGPTELSDDDLAKVDGGTAIGVAAPGDPGAPPGQAPMASLIGLDSDMAATGGAGSGKSSFDEFTITKTAIRRPPR